VVCGAFSLVSERFIWRLVVKVSSGLRGVLIGFGAFHLAVGGSSFQVVCGAFSLVLERFIWWLEEALFSDVSA